MSLAEADMGLTMMAFQQSGQLGPQPGDENMLVRFVTHVLEDKNETKKQGRPIHKEHVFVEIMAPGEREVFSELADNSHKARWPKHWEAFEKRQNQETVEGTPLSEWPGITRAMAEDLKFFNIYTVEQLATVSDGNVQNFQGLTTLREKAKKYLIYANDQAEANANDELEKRLKALEEMANKQAETIREQEAIINALKGDNGASAGSASDKAEGASTSDGASDKAETSNKRRRRSAA